MVLQLLVNAKQYAEAPSADPDSFTRNPNRFRVQGLGFQV